MTGVQTCALPIWCTAAYHDAEHEFSIIYGDYYFIEAVWKLMGKELFIWGNAHGPAAGYCSSDVPAKP